MNDALRFLLLSESSFWPLQTIRIIKGYPNEKRARLGLLAAFDDIYPRAEIIDDHVDNLVVLVLLHRLDAHFLANRVIPKLSARETFRTESLDLSTRYRTLDIGYCFKSQDYDARCRGVSSLATVTTYIYHLAIPASENRSPDSTLLYTTLLC